MYERKQEKKKVTDSITSSLIYDFHEDVEMFLKYIIR
jgi:hypothetical protein